MVGVLSRGWHPIVRTGVRPCRAGLSALPGQEIRDALGDPVRGALAPLAVREVLGVARITHVAALEEDFGDAAEVEPAQIIARIHALAVVDVAGGLLTGGLAEGGGQFTAETPRGACDGLGVGRPLPYGRGQDHMEPPVTRRCAV